MNVLETERLILRNWVESNVNRLYEMQVMNTLDQLVDGNHIGILSKVRIY